jgi:hypothetical protein
VTCDLMLVQQAVEQFAPGVLACVVGAVVRAGHQWLSAAVQRRTDRWIIRATGRRPTNRRVRTDWMRAGATLAKPWPLSGRCRRYRRSAIDNRPRTGGPPGQAA